MLRSLLFVAFQGCYYLCKLLGKAGGPESCVDPGDALNEERFYDWVHAFQIQIKEFKKGYDINLTPSDLYKCCDNESQSKSILFSLIPY